MENLLPKQKGTWKSKRTPRKTIGSQAFLSGAGKKAELGYEVFDV